MQEFNITDCFEKIIYDKITNFFKKEIMTLFKDNIIFELKNLNSLD